MIVSTWSLNFAIRSSWYEPQSAPSLDFAYCIASPSLATKNIINLILVWTIWWFPCVESSLLLLGESVSYDPCILLAKLLVFVQLHFVLQGQICLLFQVSWLSTFAVKSPIIKRTSFFCVSCRRSCRSSQNCSTSAFSAWVVGAYTWVTVTLVLPWKQPRSFCHSWDCMHFILFCGLWGLFHSFQGILAHSCIYNGHLN